MPQVLCGHQMPLASDHDATIAEFVTKMAHELRGSLNAVVGFADLLYSDAYGDLNPEQHQAVTDIVQASRRLRSITNHVLEIGRLETGRASIEPAVVSVRAAAELAAAAVAEQARDRLQRVTVDVDPALAVWADEARLRQALAALLDNALKYSDEGGLVQIKARDEGDLVALAVTDQGCGIPLEVQPRIFDDFFSLDNGDRSERGAGLGLGLARRLVHAMGGELAVESAPGAGATFTLLLPRRDPPPD